ncbi:hypothetical protein EBI_23260 [Enterocytozoon bieneusi H348]|nr:hypothetical protein EBI_23260 [Enterocytozoon bieneusi H348]|eukprot:XP_001827912.1 hypothetical protein EBI_23260 [Enterocytozoon bieneusi H348]
MIIKLIRFISFVYSDKNVNQTVKQKFLNTKGTIIDLNLTKNNDIAYETINIPYKTILDNVEIIYGDNLEALFKIHDHLGSKIIYSNINKNSSYIVLLSEFTKFIIPQENDDLFNLKEKLIDKLYESDNLFFSITEAVWFVNKINSLNKFLLTKIIQDEKIINIEAAQNELIKILNEMNIHIDLDKLPIIKQESIDKIIYKVFYLTFKNKNNGKKYKTPIYKIRIKNNCISDINMIFKKKEILPSIILIGSITLLIIIGIIIIYIYKNKSVKPRSIYTIKNIS